MLSYALSVMLTSSRHAMMLQDTMARMTSSESSGGPTLTEEQKERNARYASFKAIAKAFFVALSFTLVGTFFYCYYDEEKENFVDPKGEVDALTNAFYMAVITVTSVGYGDFSPSSQNGRLFA